MRRIVLFSWRADADLRAMTIHIGKDSPRAGRDFADSIREHCLGFSTFAERGRCRPDIGKNVRIVGFDRKATIAFRVEAEVVTILRIFYRGRNVDAAIGRLGGRDRD